MKLSDEHFDTIVKKLNEASPDGITCPICGKKQWAINNFVVESREFQHGDLFIGGNSSLVPFVIISCTNCANTIFLNAIQLGVVNPKQENDLNKENNGK